MTPESSWPILAFICDSLPFLDKLFKPCLNSGLKVHSHGTFCENQCIKTRNWAKLCRRQ